MLTNIQHCEPRLYIFHLSELLSDVVKIVQKHAQWIDKLINLRQSIKLISIGYPINRAGGHMHGT